VKVAVNPKKYDYYKNDYTEDGTPIKSVTQKPTMSEDAVLSTVMNGKNE
jgi:hypothetical protein